MRKNWIILKTPRWRITHNCHNKVMMTTQKLKKESIQIKMKKIIHKKITRVKQLKDPNPNWNLTQISKSEKEKNNEKSTRGKKNG